MILDVLFKKLHFFAVQTVLYTITLVIDQVQDIFSHFEIRIFWKFWFQIPKPTRIQNPEKQGPEKVPNQNRPTSNHSVKNGKFH